MKKVMAIFAHPDDEGAVAGTLYQYIQNGMEAILVCATRGEVGQISDPTLATPETLGEVRTKELEKACEMLGIQHLEFLDYRDSGMDGTPENDDPTSFLQADEGEVVAKIVGLLQKYEPDVVITFEPFGWYGHPDHKTGSKHATTAFFEYLPRASNNPRLFHSVIAFSQFESIIKEAIEGGHIEPPENTFGEQIPKDLLLATEAKVTHEIDVRDTYDLTQEAMASHKTQFSDDSLFRKIPKELTLRVWGHNRYIQIYPEPAEGLTTNRRNDLFA